MRFNPCFRIGGPELGRLSFGGRSAWAPGGNELYSSIFQGLAERLSCDLFISVLNSTSRIAIARMLDPLEVVAVPLEWEDHDFYVLTQAELEGPLTSTACFAAPQKSLREALSWTWSDEHSQLWFPLLGISPYARNALTRWHSWDQSETDARDLLLKQYEGILFIYCPRALYVAGSEGVVNTVIEVLTRIEETLSRDGWLERARAQVVCSVDGNYYTEGDPRIQMDTMAGRLDQLATP